MASKFKLTGFARFFFAMLIIIPSAYFGAAYLNGEDPVANIKQVIGMEESDDKNDVINISAEDETSSNEENSSDLNSLKERISTLEEENTKLKRIIKNREQEIKALKNK